MSVRANSRKIRKKEHRIPIGADAVLARPPPLLVFLPFFSLVFLLRCLDIRYDPKRVLSP